MCFLFLFVVVFVVLGGFFGEFSLVCFIFIRILLFLPCFSENVVYGVNLPSLCLPIVFELLTLGFTG